MHSVSVERNSAVSSHQYLHSESHNRSLREILENCPHCRGPVNQLVGLGVTNEIKCDLIRKKKKKRDVVSREMLQHQS